MEKALTFNAVEFTTITRNNQPWIRGPQLGGALGYAKGKDSVLKIYESHADEFTDEMTAVVKLPTEGGEQDVRIFSLRGCHLLAMFARTPVAKAFRKWVLDVLDRLDRERQTTEQPAPQATTPGDALLQWLLAKEISRAAEEGRPFTRFGKVSGLHARRCEMDIPLRVLGWKKLQKLFAGLQERGLVTIGKYSKSGGRHLDARVPQRPKPALPPMVKRPAAAIIPEDDRHFAVCAELKAIVRRLEHLCPAMAQANYPRYSRRSEREQNRYEMQASLYRMGNASLKTAIASLTASWQIWEMMKA